ncbi:xylulokinase [Arthrobacter bambusae]|uniref:xylulokinase n=1 Tax=Arthrobacter bambusae TaxID=1338426 RepID=UPI00278476D3|nr:FGGY-family carbohydrate kinase [Arthrobacter bambusae]MDQ0031496.1 sugar (pentulose or hexulose) kinase [Arthrobacter bambusae]MDQ0099719.1 sugar (pentulose or hexulose) kinase [Arthrobacter bambusae]
MNLPGTSSAADAIRSGRARLGIELGSTRIKACLIGDDPRHVLALGSFSWESSFQNAVWTYSLTDVWTGIQAAYADLVANCEERYGVQPRILQAIGVSAMMHGYLVFDCDDQQLVPFRTWRNTTTGAASAELTKAFDLNIPLRWSIAHLHQAVSDGEDHVPRINFMTTLAGYVHWRLTGRKVIGIGDASGMFPIDSASHTYDSDLLARYKALVAHAAPALDLSQVLPEVLVAGEYAGTLTDAGAALLDSSGALQPGAVFCPPEGDAGTGMVATCSIAPRTGNVSVGTSIFAMVVLERPLAQVRHELDLVTTPAGAPVAMVHCNNGASELAAWVQVFTQFARKADCPIDQDTVFTALLQEALEGDPDAGGLIAYNYVAGEPLAGVRDGRPLLVRAPDSTFTLANFVRSQVYGVFATLILGMRVLADEGVAVDRMFAHGGMFRTAGIAQRFLAGALNAPVSVAESASEGGAWGIAVLAAFATHPSGDLNEFLRNSVFGGAAFETTNPDPADVTGFSTYLDRYAAGLAVQRAAVDSISPKGSQP